MRYPKFIITSKGCLRLGMVTLHRQLIEAGEQCLGGGFYEFDYTARRLLLSGESSDYGPPRWRRLAVLKVPSEYAGWGIIYSLHGERDMDIADELEIEYV